MTDTRTPSLTDFANLPLDLVFEVARFEVKLEQLANLSPGTVLTPAAENMNHVDIRVDDTTLALGDITTLDGVYGVCVLQLPDTGASEV